MSKSINVGSVQYLYFKELQSENLYIQNYKQPQLQDPWNEPLAPVLVFFGGEAADGEGDGLPQPPNKCRHV